jgi:hypothetical protein
MLTDPKGGFTLTLYDFNFNWHSIFMHYIPLTRIIERFCAALLLQNQNIILCAPSNETFSSQQAQSVNVSVARALGPIFMFNQRNHLQAI